jgi:hypothetical protein
LACFVRGGFLWAYGVWILGVTNVAVAKNAAARAAVAVAAENKLRVMPIMAL